MKIYLLLPALIFATSVIAQSKKDSLFSGKIKNPLAQTPPPKDTTVVAATTTTPTTTPATTTTGALKTEAAAVVVAPAGIMNEEVKPAEATMLPDSLNKLFHAKQRLWKRFIDQNTMIVAAQADDTRKVKKGEYIVDIDYEIGLNGRVTTIGVICSPQNDFIVDQVKEFMSRPPVLSPPLYSDGKPRKHVAKQSLTILKK